MKARASSGIGAGGAEIGGPVRSGREPHRPGGASRRYAVAGAILLLVGGALALRQSRQGAWPSVEATVQSIRVVSDTTRDKPGGGTRAIFRPEVQYRYLGPDGQSQDTTGWASRWSSDAQAAQNFVDDFPAGTAVTIRQDPRNEGIVRLNARTNVLSLGLPWLVMLSGVSFGAVAWRSARRRNRDATRQSLVSGPP